MAAEDGGGGWRSNPISRLFMRAAISNEPKVTAKDIRDLKEVSELIGSLGEATKSRGLRILSEFFRDLADHERDYLSLSELGLCVGTLLFYGGILTIFYEMYMSLSEEEARIIREMRRRNRGDNSSGNSNNGSGNNNGSNSSGNSNNNET